MTDWFETVPDDDAAHRSRHSAGRRGRGRRILALAAAVLLVAVAVVSVVVARQENANAARWRDRAQAEQALQAPLDATVAKARSSITTLDAQASAMAAQVKDLTGQVSGLQAQLSAVANQKEKALDQDSVLSELITQAADVSQRLLTCVQDTDSFISALDEAQAAGGVDAGVLADGQSVDSECAAAETSNENLQALIAANVSP